MELKGLRADAYTVSDDFDEARATAYRKHLFDSVDQRRQYRYDQAKSLHEVFRQRMRSVSGLNDVWLPWGYDEISVDTLLEIRLAREPGSREWDGLSVQHRYVTDDGLASDPFISFALRWLGGDEYHVVNHEMVMDGEFEFVDLASLDTSSYLGLDLETIRDFYEHHADNVQPSRVD